MNGPPYLPSYLTEQQRAAILHQGGPLLIIAGPGSGRTEVVTWRAEHGGSGRGPGARGWDHGHVSAAMASAPPCPAFRL